MSAPKVIGASAVAANKVQVQFNQGMLQDATLIAPGSYSIVGAVVTNVVAVGPAFVELTLANEMLAGKQYIVIVQEAVKNQANEILSPAFKDAAFIGQGDPPVLLTVVMTDEETIVATYDQDVAAGVNCFFFIGPSIVAILDVQIAGAVVTLKVQPDLLHQAIYKLVSLNVEDTVGNKSLKAVEEFEAIGDQPTLASAILDGNILILTFSKPMSADIALTSPESYVIVPIDAGAGPIHVAAAAAVKANVVWLEITDGKIGATYEVTVAADVRDFAGNVIDSTADSAQFDVVAADFRIVYAKAIAERGVLVVFNRPPEHAPATLLPANYSIPNLGVISIELMGAAVILKTAPQTQGFEYQLTTSNLKDEAQNALNDTAHPFIGWKSNLNSGIVMYDFIYAAIRHTDERQGTGILRRLCAGWQDVWTRLVELREGLLKQISPLTVSAEFLSMELWSAGWSDGHEEFVESLDERTARRLLLESASLWRDRGSETAYENGIGLLAPVRVVIRNWFWARWVEGEDWFGEDRRGRDVHILDLPGYGNDEYYSQIRVVDGDGKLNRPQIEHMIETLRPIKEIVQVAYIQFFSKFATGDHVLFETPDAIDIEDSISGGELEFDGPASVFAVCRELGDSVLYARVRGDGVDYWGVQFRYQDALNFYWVGIRVDTKLVTFGKVVAGVSTTLAEKTQEQIFVPLKKDLPYGFRIQMVGTQIRVFLDGSDLFLVNDGSLTTGKFGLFANSHATVAASEIEGFALPLDIATLGI